jgi:hypothetical protein
VKKRTEFAMKGADAEFGWHLLKPQENYTLYAAAGPYYYNGEEKHAWGGKVRVEGRITPYVTLEVSDSFDNIFHNIVQGTSLHQYPLRRKNPKEKRPVQNFLLDGFVHGSEDDAPHASARDHRRRHGKKTLL